MDMIRKAITSCGTGFAEDLMNNISSRRGFIMRLFLWTSIGSTLLFFRRQSTSTTDFMTIRYKQAIDIIEKEAYFYTSYYSKEG